MPIEKSKPSNSAKTAPQKPKSAKSDELRDDELRTISGGMTSGVGTGAASCVSQT